MPSSLHSDASSVGGTTDGGVNRDLDRTVVMGEASGPVAEPEGTAVDEGATLGRFVVLEQIGAGAMGRVLRGYDSKLRREVALKLVRSSSEATTARLMREAQAMAQLSHPNVVPVYDVGEHGSEVFIAMEYVPGRTLRDWWAEEKPEWRTVVAVFREAGEGLAAAHRVGLVHRDFKPDNVLVSPRDDGRLDRPGRVRVMDFGLARAMDERPSHEIGRASLHGSVELVSGSFALALTQVGTVLGTPAYMAPEQHRGRGVDAKSDQYAFCVALYEALWGHRPFKGDKLQELAAAKERGDIRSVPPDAPPVPRWVRRIVLRGLVAEPAQRWPSMEALVAALGRDPSRTRARWLGATAIVAAAGVSIAFAGRKPALCTGAPGQLDGVWDASRRGALEAALSATSVPHAAETWMRVEQAVDAYAQRWIDGHTDACEATHLRREQSQAVMDARMQCLHARRRDLSALVDALSHADAEVAHKAVDAVHRLPALAPCADVESVLAQVPPPDDPEVRERVESIRGQLAQANALSAAGRYDEGLALAERAHADALAVGYPPLVPEAAYSLAVLLEETGSYEPSAERLQESYFEGRRTGMDEVAARAAAALVFTLGERLARHDEAFVWAEHAEAEIARFGTETMRATLYQNLAALHRAAGDLERAQEIFERALSLCERALGPDHPQTGRAVMGLALLQAERGHLDEAERLHMRAMAIDEVAFGVEHPNIAHSLTNLGSVAWRRGDLDDAHHLYRRALLLNETVRGPEHPVTARLMMSLANIHAVRGELDDAERLYARSHAIAERALGPDHPEVGHALVGLAIVLTQRGELERARDLYEQAIAIEEQAFGPEHPALATAVNNLANVHYELGSLTEARALYERALAINEAAYGAEHPDVASSLENLAWVCWKRGELEEGFDFAERALSMTEALLGESHPKYAAAAVVAAHIALARGRAGDCLPALERALDSMQRRTDAPPETVPDTRFALARALWEAPVTDGRDRARAFELAERARTEYRELPVTPPDLEQVESWLATHRHPRGR